MESITNHRDATYTPRVILCEGIRPLLGARVSVSDGGGGLMTALDPGGGRMAAGRFAAVAWLVLFTAGELTAAGLELWDTGQAPHYDVVHANPVELVTRMLGTAHRVVPNPHHRPGG